MKDINRKVTASLGLAIAAIPSIALAQSPMIVVAAAGGAAGTAAIPTMSGSLMIALAALLAVVAVRFLRQKGIQQKIISLMLLGSGLVICGLGVQETLATSVTVSVDSSACSGGTVTLDPSRGDGYDPSAELFNQCDSTSIEVISYEGYPCPSVELIHQGAQPGAVIAAGASALLSYCPAVET